MFKNLVLFCLSLLLCSSVAWSQSHKGIAFQGVIKLPSGSLPTQSGITVSARILSPNDCILREEQFNSVNISNGYLYLAVGTGAVGGYDPGFSMKKTMDNSTTFSSLTCLNLDGTVNPAVTTFNPAVTSGARKLRVAMTIDSYPIVADFNMRSMAFAINSESLNGKTDSNFINTSSNITQSAVEAWFAGAILGQLSGGTYNAPTATTAVTAQGLAASYTVPLSQGGTGATTVAGARTNLQLGPLATMNPTGTASATTYLRGDGRWETVTGGVSSVATKTGDVTLVAADITDFNSAADSRITAQKGANNGLATLNGSGKVPSSQLALTISDIPGLSASHITAGTFADSMLAGLSIDKLINGSNKYFNYKPNDTACSDNEVLKYDSTLLSGQGGWKCAPDSGVGAESDPTVQVYAKNAPSTGLKINGTNQLTVDFGTTAGTVVQGNDARLAGAFSSSTALSGDLSGTLPSPVVEKIKGQSLSATGSLAGQMLRYAGGNIWTPSFVSMSDLRSSVTGAAALTGVGCTAGQTLTWSSATDTLTCISISVTKSQISDFPTLALSATTDTTNATNITSGTLDAARLPSSVTAGLWTEAAGNVSRATGSVGVGTSTPHASAALDVSSTAKGFLPPRMTTIERDAIASPTNGLIIFNTTTKRLNIYSDATWADLFTDNENSFSVHRAGSSQTFAQSTDVLVDWTTTNFDTTGTFNLTANRFQPTKAGKYLISANIACVGMDATNWCVASLRKNNATVAHQGVYAGLNGSTMGVNLSTVISLNGTTDYVDVWVNSNDVNPTLSGDMGHTNFTGFLVNGSYALGGGGGGADNLGNHIATQNINLGSNWISGNGSNTGLRVDASGNVGVGTASPTAELEVAGTVKATELSGPWDHTPSGYIRLGDVQIAWGTTGVIADGGNVSITFPAAFSSLPSVTLSSTYRNSYQCSSGWNGTDSRTTTGFKVYVEAGADNKCSWMAIGPWR